MDSPHTRLYRARDGMVLGVCKGFARYRDLPVAAVRIGMVLLTLFTGFWPGVALYFLAGFLLEPEPELVPETAQESEFYARFHGSRVVAIQDLKSKMDRLDARLQRMEDRVIKPDFDWEVRFKR